MAEGKNVRAQIQEGFYPQNAPMLKGAVRTDEITGRKDRGLVPQAIPVKPSDKEDKGFVPPRPPRKPPDKPDKKKI